MSDAPDPTPYEAALLGRPALRLLVAALRSDVRPAEAVARAEADDVDWEAVGAQARAHRIVPHVTRTLGAEPSVPEAIRARLRLNALHSARHQLRLAHALEHVREALATAGVPSLPLKGPTLSAWLYGDPARRSSGDLDVLVPPEWMAEAVAAVRAAGFDAAAPGGDHAYRLLTPDEAPVVVGELGDNDVAFFHPGLGVVLELHWRPFLDERLRHVADALAAGMREGGEATVGPAPAVVAYVLAHGAFHGYRRLAWLADAAAVVARAGPEAVVEGVTLARADGIEAAALLGPFLAHRLLGTALPPALHPWMATQEERLRRIAAACAEPVSSGYALRSVDSHRVRTGLYDRRRDRLRYVWDRLTRPYRADLPHERLDGGGIGRVRRRLRRPLRLAARRLRRR